MRSGGIAIADWGVRFGTLRAASLWWKREQELGMDPATNVFGEPIESCSEDPMTGFFRDGCCNTSDEDVGRHTVCTRVTAEFLEFSRSRGNDLSTPREESGFSGLRPGDQWCLCAARWQEAFEASAAPRVVLRATHAATLKIVAMEHLKRHAIDLS